MPEREQAKQHRRIRVIGAGAARHDPAALLFAGRGPRDGTFLDRRRRRRLPKQG